MDIGLGEDSTEKEFSWKLVLLWKTWKYLPQRVWIKFLERFLAIWLSRFEVNKPWTLMSKQDLLSRAKGGAKIVAKAERVVDGAPNV